MNRLERLCKLNAVSGYEYMSDDKLFEIIKEFGLVPQKDKYGNIFAQKFSEKSDFSLLLDAHRDEIGLVVTEVLKNGFLKFAPVGGVDLGNLFCTEVTVYGSEPIYGIIGAVPPHLDKKDGETQLIDTGIKDISKYVSVGDPIKFRTNFMRLKNSRITSGALDDRAGLYCALLAAKKTENADVTVLASVREETGTQGIEHFLNKHSFDLAINIDVTHGWFEGLPDYRAYPIGGGFTICYGGILDNRITKIIENKLKKEEIPFNIEFEPENPGTNAYNTVTHNVPAIMLSIPLKYMHTTCETLSVKDIKSLSRFISKFDWNSLKKEGDAIC